MPFSDNIDSKRNCLHLRGKYASSWNGLNRPRSYNCHFSSFNSPYYSILSTFHQVTARGDNFCCTWISTVLFLLLTMNCVYTIGAVQPSSPDVNIHNVHEGDSVLLLCNFSDSIFSSLLWSVDGELIFERQLATHTTAQWSSDKGQLTSDNALEIYSVDLEDSGKYTCKVLNLGTIIATIIHQLIVEVDKPLLQHSGTNLVLSEGSTLSLNCTGLFPLEWTYPAEESKVQIGSQLTPPVNGSLLTSIWKESSSLTVENLTVEDSGQYRCSHRGMYHSAEEKWSATGVFVTDESAADQGFLPYVDSSPITVYPGQPFVIPCRSYPNRSITLRPTADFWENKEERRVRRAYLDNLPYLHHAGFSVDAYHLWFGDRMRCLIKDGYNQQFFNLTVVDIPSIDAGSEVILAEGDALQLSCTGRLRILWSFPNIDDSPIPRLASHKDSRTGLFTSHLRINSARSSSSGSYSCFYSIFRDDELEVELKASTYIYVASKDSEVDFLPISQEDNRIHISGDSFEIPCRVNNPNTTVTLKLCYREQDNCQSTVLDRYNQSYEPKRGFILKRNSADETTPNFHLQAHCSTKNDFQSFYLFFDDGKESGLMVEVTASSEKIFTNSSELNVTCQVEILKLLLVDHTLRPKLTWDFPQEEVEDHVILYNEHTTDSDETFSFYSHLRLFNISSNEGLLTFTCSATNNMFKSQKSVNVNVYDEAFINIYNLNNNQNQFIHHLGGSGELCLNVRVVSFPSVNVTWQQNDDTIYPPSFPSLSISDDGDPFNRTYSLCFDVFYSNTTGNYTINARNEFVQKDMMFEVLVFVPPSIKLDLYEEDFEVPFPGGSPLYFDGELYTINCEADGYPAPMVHWEYSECKAVSTDNEKCTPEGRETERFSKQTGLDYIFSNGEATPWRNELELEAGISAIFKCVATSTEFPHQPAEAYFRFLVLTAKEAFSFDIPDGIYADQQVNIECVVNGFSFKDTKIGRKSNESSPIIPLDSKMDQRITETTILQDNSRKRTVRISKVRLEDAGEYYCMATTEVPHHVDFMEKRATLVVKEIIPAEVHCSSENITHDVNAGDLIINCTVTGDPRPSASWQFPHLSSRNKVTEGTYVNSTTIWTTCTVPVNYLRKGSTRELIVTGRNLGRTGTTIIRLTGVASPRFDSPKEVIEELEGTNFSMSCSATGTPQPLIVWSKKANDQTDQIETLRMNVVDGVFTFIEAAVTDSGIYICNACNDYGSAERIYNVTIKPLDKKPGTFPSFSIILIAISAGMCFFIVLACITQRKNSKDRHLQYTLSQLNEFNRGGFYPMHMQGMLAEEIYERLPYDPRWEFTRERLILGPVIGRGAFGMVIKAKAVGIENLNRSTIVAVKTLKDEATDTEKKALWAELKLLAHVGRHLNVVNFLGACTTGSPLLLIVEFCTYGNLSDYLRKRRRIFYGSRDNTGSDSSHMSTSTSFPNLSNESNLQPVRENRHESHRSNNQTTSTGGTCDSAIGNSPTDSPFFSKSKGTPQHNIIITSNSSHNVRLKSRSSVDLTNTDLLPKRKGAEKSSSNDSGQELPTRESKRTGLNTASSMGSLNRNTISQIRNTISPLHHPQLQFEDSVQSAFELPLREEDLICYAFQTARGMDFLSSKQVIHRDLAARNVLLTDSNVVKICDFGLARHLYQNPDYIASGKGRFPVKWMAPESIFDKVYTTQTDIWSFGVLLWEIFSLGGSPYPGLQMDENFYSKLKEGYRMSPPEIAPPEIGDIMYDCWNDAPKERPPFSELEIKLGDLLAASTRLEYVEMNNPYEDMTAELEAQQQEHLKETALLLPANSFESLTEPPASPTETETPTENSNEPPSLSDFHQTTLV
ncbi:vascular endothelial growth factor receptor 1-like isoform X2 [Apostichopus japonicus]|uniref:vascular endothelial growth factor receptor 1-like isoform X2 n=1 Tax=Stichopus japonicus TaxID=307972 RepID=UPI003AB45C42